ncbi:hypothetical protein P7K49_015665 [Saguinus oedipus]|uniref:Uncharacterized protein n=1 Tax=Saguinus oedipus TaxID=9490 RepID=A0ABQ9V9W7_SAGOE|nr:hypothetical protein P7K49_015665 [Saguinus oedipus]
MGRGKGDQNYWYYTYYTYTKLLAISCGFKQNPKQFMITWILQVHNQWSHALSLNSWELVVLLDNLTHNAIFNYHCNALFGQWHGTACLAAHSLLSVLKVLPALRGHQAAFLALDQQGGVHPATVQDGHPRLDLL